MRIFRRWGALSMSAMLIGTFLSAVALTTGGATPASANSPEAFAGSASATALHLSLLGINLTVDKTDATADSTPKATADAAILAPGSLLTLDSNSVTAPSSGGTTTVASPVCNGALALTAIISITAVCAQSAAAVPPDAAPAACTPPSGAVAPMACGSAKVLEIDVGLTQLLQPILTAVKNSLQGLSTTVGNILNNIPVVSPLLNNLLNSPLLSGLGINLSDPISSLLDALNRATELLSIQVLPSVSAVTTTAGALTAAAEADGIVVTLLPGVLLTNDLPALDLHVAEGSAISSYNRTTCKSSSTFTGGLLSGELLGTPLNVNTGTISLGGLGSIALGSGSNKTNADGTVTATADGLNVNLLNGLVVLDAGHATSTVGGACAVVTPPTTAGPTTVSVQATSLTTKPAVLATTGADDTPLLAIGFFLVLAGYLTRRRWLSQRASSSN